MKRVLFVFLLLLSVAGSGLAHNTRRARPYRVSIDFGCKFQYRISRNRPKEFRKLLPGAWCVAQHEAAGLLTGYKEKILALSMPKVGFRRGMFYDPDTNEYEYGYCDNDANPPVVIGLVRSPKENFATAVHEFVHYIADALPLDKESKKACHSWIDWEKPKNISKVKQRNLVKLHTPAWRTHVVIRMEHRPHKVLAAG